MLHDNYSCWVESNKQQIEEVEATLKQKTRKRFQATSERVWNRPVYSASAAFA